ncbi:MAG: hypothetical protein AB1627_15385 [Chloroflexota bacterium]
MTSELRSWIEAQLDAGAGALDLSQDPDEDAEGDEDGEYEPDDTEELEEGDELEEDDPDEKDEEPYRPPTAPALVAAVLGGDLDLGDMDPDAWFSWALSAPDAEWARAATQADYPGAERIKAHHLPDALRVGLMQAELDERVRQAKEGQRR